ncbi:hypothetical protein [Flagellimonas sediminis]|uniref:Uncharacterized protein n=1 Tax=Flagellimonas sediminis TaxID=2696468 RepID=A0A6I5KQ87_9FLAO|nr:hypothetical protein [Allomuricauda sediminis]NDV41869.1 hypothetical protein [Allomuricauda sediminis]
MTKLFLPLFLIVLVYGCSDEENPVEPEAIEPKKMSIAIDMSGDFEVYDTQLSIFSFGEERVSVNGGAFSDSIIQYELGSEVHHVFEFEDDLVSLGLRIALGQVKGDITVADSAVIKISAFVNEKLFDEQTFITKPESERDTIGLIYNALGKQFVEFDTRN